MEPPAIRRGDPMRSDPVRLDSVRFQRLWDQMIRMKKMMMVMMVTGFSLFSLHCALNRTAASSPSSSTPSQLHHTETAPKQQRVYLSVSFSTNQTRFNKLISLQRNGSVKLNGNRKERRWNTTATVKRQKPTEEEKEEAKDEFKSILSQTARLVMEPKVPEVISTTNRSSSKDRLSEVSHAHSRSEVTVLASQ
ncbi:hypothetical protein Baya_16800 [Bagarius yarrelli]|uniref:Uncharacterized protein n=1 Tax=Bagarius yarrelli TaxID=175774 RepID=A0A556VWG2_BAGYA|nr:hypothetical protein Baya_16800 [Bagarius yarrelli]